MKILLLYGSLYKLLIYRIPLINLPGKAKVENSGPDITARVQVTIRNILLFPITWSGIVGFSLEPKYRLC